MLQHHQINPKSFSLKLQLQDFGLHCPCNINNINTINSKTNNNKKQTNKNQPIITAYTCTGSCFVLPFKNRATLSTLMKPQPEIIP